MSVPADPPSGLYCLVFDTLADEDHGTAPVFASPAVLDPPVCGLVAAAFSSLETIVGESARFLTIRADDATICAATAPLGRFMIAIVAFLPSLPDPAVRARLSGIASLFALLIPAWLGGIDAAPVSLPDSPHPVLAMPLWAVHLASVVIADAWAAPISPPFMQTASEPNADAQHMLDQLMTYEPLPSDPMGPGGAPPFIPICAVVAHSGVVVAATGPALAKLVTAFTASALLPSEVGTACNALIALAAPVPPAAVPEWSSLVHDSFAYIRGEEPERRGVPASFSVETDATDSFSLLRSAETGASGSFSPTLDTAFPLLPHGLSRASAFLPASLVASRNGLVTVAMLLLRVPQIALAGADPARQFDVQRAAALLADQFSKGSPALSVSHAQMLAPSASAVDEVAFAACVGGEAASDPAVPVGLPGAAFSVRVYPPETADGLSVVEEAATNPTGVSASLAYSVRQARSTGHHAAQARSLAATWAGF
jgi:hypothetical protein